MSQTTHIIYVAIIYMLLISPEYIDAALTTIVAFIAPEVVVIVPMIRELFITIPVLIWMLIVTYRLICDLLKQLYYWPLLLFDAPITNA